MDLHGPDIDSVKRLVQAGRFEELNSIDIERLTIGALVEFACCWRSWPTEVRNECHSAMKQWSARLPLLGLAEKLLRTVGIAPPIFQDPFGAPDRAVYAIPQSALFVSPQVELLWEQFRRALQQHGFGQELSRALSQAFAEMADNVLQHSGIDRDHPAPGIMAYHVINRQMSFAVGDLGQGVLSSLYRNPKWQHLDSESAALDAAVMGQATSKPNEEYGDGFARVHRSIADLNGTLRFVSGAAVLSLQGGSDQRRVTTAITPGQPGLQLSVNCALAENMIPIFIEGH